eukprot:TRINITY_DN11549_c0_g1_i1.p1 TRINITY_DN11549_c0_g1~~TRINITY_DN11549_c0_g1_i1.p1  ORF type:complete len:332 (+),score=41.27 TRINITY_DN11549_c0_g1_i1:92-1087(+)
MAPSPSPSSSSSQSGSGTGTGSPAGTGTASPAVSPPSTATSDGDAPSPPITPEKRVAFAAPEVDDAEATRRLADAAAAGAWRCAVREHELHQLHLHMHAENRRQAEYTQYLQEQAVLQTRIAAIQGQLAAMGHPSPPTRTPDMVPWENASSAPGGATAAAAAPGMPRHPQVLPMSCNRPYDAVRLYPGAALVAPVPAAPPPRAPAQMTFPADGTLPAQLSAAAGPPTGYADPAASPELSHRRAAAYRDVVESLASVTRCLAARAQPPPRAPSAPSVPYASIGPGEEAEGVWNISAAPPHGTPHWGTPPCSADHAGLAHSHSRGACASYPYP